MQWTDIWPDIKILIHYLVSGRPMPDIIYIRFRPKVRLFIASMSTKKIVPFKEITQGFFLIWIKFFNI
jgi:hypothetical protein